ncbi:TRAP-type C4-dicarboxylate transport system permease small subunit [Desulfobotulus alkaliphilus]|uniref:TRAP-type C4-dicarboxylate transport system permease small subunit n=1 Tax=Desulfobotulus alkaliphilus TaxID=622671 RepID=A0A562RYZ1_9BACT|nr:TRAP transporter small permease [Desulfobotulus alkaliphilus]TWI74359.1 TRAP-type C4-dicarboxylate transport system permease small subunit [Desulfobotulus alkaliphilus]
MKRFGRFLDLLEEWTLFAAVMAALAGLLISVILRYGFHVTFAGADELVRNTIIYTSFVGLSVAIRKDRLIRVDALAQIFPRLKRLLAMISLAAVVFFALLMIRFGGELMMMMFRTGQSTIIWNMPLWILYAILPFSGLLMIIRAGEQMWWLWQDEGLESMEQKNT